MAKVLPGAREMNPFSVSARFVMAGVTWAPLPERTMMPKDGSSRRKRRARELRMREGLRYTEALRRSDPSIGEPRSHADGAEPAEDWPTVLDVLHIAVEQLKATDPADVPAVLRIAYEVLDLTSAADGLLEETLLDVDFARFWPGNNGLGPDRQKLEVALAWLGAAPSIPDLIAQHDRVTMLAPMDMAVSLYPGRLSDPVTGGEVVELVLIQARIVAVAIRAIWAHTAELLSRTAGHARDHDDAKSCRVAAVMARELAHPESINRQRGIERRILLAANPQHSRAELLADEALMNLLYEAVAATARGNTWSRMSEVTEACMKADRAWACERWGFKADIALVAATGKFAIRRVQCKGQTVIEIRRRRAERGVGAGRRQS